MDLAPKNVAPPTLRGKVLGLLLPTLLVVAIFGPVFALLGPDTGKAVGGLMAGSLLPPAGKESAIPIGIARGIDPWVVALMVGSVDIIVALYLIGNFWVLYYIPLLGGWVRRVESKGGDIFVKRPWLRRFAFFGIVLWVIVPFQGTGAVTASILGRLLGLGALRTFAATSIGALLGSLLIAFLAVSLREAAERGLLIGVAVGVGLVAGFLVFYFRVWKRT